MRRKVNWRKYTAEFISVFVAVFLAFALNNWSENRRDDEAESKILMEIAHGLGQDLEDLDLNLIGHRMGLRSCRFWKEVITGQDADSTEHFISFYFGLTRDLVAIHNKSGYETLKSRGFELIKDDSLRTAIINLYEVQYQILKKLEEDYYESQFQENYFSEFNSKLSPFFTFDDSGELVGIDTPVRLSDKDRKLLLSYLWKIKMNRGFIMDYYKHTRDQIVALENKIKTSLRG